MKKLACIFLIALIGCAKDPVADGHNGTFKDSRDDHTYKSVKIGTQTWMADNLAYLPAVSPSSDESISSAFYYVYNYEGSSIDEAKSTTNYTSYGVLYNWEAAKIACPSGWHLPNDEEWAILVDYLGALPGKKMKSVTGWSTNGNGDNSSGFNALPVGVRNNGGGFRYLSEGAFFWSASENDPWSAWYRNVAYNNDDVYRTMNYRPWGFSVRCITDN